MTTVGGEEPRLQAPHLRQLRMDQLLDELQTRIDSARGTRDRVHSLLEAVLSVGRQLDLAQVLREITEAAAHLVDARYAALGVIGPDGERLSQFLTFGLDDEQTARIGHPPEGHGILGELIRHPEPLRLTELGDHPSSYGFPPDHPPMHTFLGVPIRVRDEVFGNLYLTDKKEGADFDEDDEAVLTTLSVAAGVAVDNARLYEASQRQQRWTQASAEITRSLLSGSTRAQVLELIADRAREILGADLADVSVRVPEREELVVELATGAGADERHGSAVPLDGTLPGHAYRTGEPSTCVDLARDATPYAAEGFGPAVAVPLGIESGETPGSVKGVLLLARRSGAPALTREETSPLGGFAGQAALALELAERRRDAEQLALLEDRDRIARDLHDLAIQRLFATGMTLQGASRTIEEPAAAERVLRAVGDLDETIKIIRSTIFGLRAAEQEAGPGLRSRVVRAVEESAAVLGFPPRLSMEGLLDTDVPADVAQHVLAALGEALSNAARHAKAGRVEVALQAAAGRVVLTVSDDGVGIPEDGRRSGLENLAARARKLGGSLELGRPEGGGSTLVWTARTG